MPDKASLIVFCHLRWNFVFQRPQHLHSRLAQHYHVIFVEEPILAVGEAPHWKYHETPEGVTVAQPHTPIEAYDNSSLPAFTEKSGVR